MTAKLATVEILPDVSRFITAMARETVHPRSAWDQAVARIAATVADSDALAALLRTIPRAGWTPAESVAIAEAVAARLDPKPMGRPTRPAALHVTRAPIDRALGRKARR